MKNEKQNCCFCFNIVSKGNTVGTDILDLLKFLIVNVEISALENSTVCDDCLRKITETCEYKSRNSLKMLVQIKKETDSEKRIICQKCEKLCEQGNIFPLLDCITQVDWSDFVNYLFVDHDLQSLESLQICDSCRISVSNIQDFLKLIYVYDQNRMKLDINNCDDIKATGNKNLVDDRVVIKQEFENFILDDKNVMDNKTEILYSDSKNDGDNISYSDFKCKNEEVELKLEYDDANNQSIDRYVGNETTSSGSPNQNGIKDEVNIQSCDRLRYEGVKVRKNSRDLKCSYCSKEFVRKTILDNHLLRIHQCRDGITSKIHECNKCSYSTTNKDDLSRHTVIHCTEFKCQKCTYETSDKRNLNKHMKIHNIGNYKCILCSEIFNCKIYLDDHLLKVHKSKDYVASKIYECDKCNYETTRKNYLLKHKLEHGIVTELKYKCQYCTYETHFKSNLNRHIKMHNNIRDFKCPLCSKKFTHRIHLDDHLLRIHKDKDSVTSKIHECDKCSFSTINSGQLARHKLKHGIYVEQLKIHKCQYCVYETYDKRCLIRHIKKH